MKATTCVGTAADVTPVFLDDASRHPVYGFNAAVLTAPWRVGAAREAPVVAAGLVLVLLALRARAADSGSLHPVSA